MDKQAITTYIENNKQRFLDELFNLLRIPSVSADENFAGDVVICLVRRASVGSWFGVGVYHRPRHLLLRLRAGPCEAYYRFCSRQPGSDSLAAWSTYRADP